MALLCKKLVTEVPWQEAWPLLSKPLQSLLCHIIAIYADQGNHFHGSDVWLIGKEFNLVDPWLAITGFKFLKRGNYENNIMEI